MKSIEEAFVVEKRRAKRTTDEIKLARGSPSMSLDCVGCRCCPPRFWEKAERRGWALKLLNTGVGDF